MKNYDLEINNTSIKESIERDTLNRNYKLNKLIELLNTIENNKIISINGEWGCGKTFFLKQLEYINKNDFTNEKLISENIDKFKEIYEVYYYNAWENDQHTSPLLSLIYNLINDYGIKESEVATGKMTKAFDLVGLLKRITYDFIDLEKVTSYEDIVYEIHTFEEKKDALNEILDKIIPENKRLIFIIDELDRCSPNFAVNMIEVIKHFYSNNRIVFLLGTNNLQLSYTVSNYYGNNFDGYGYLNKIYNLVIELDNIDVETYLNKIVDSPIDSQWYITLCSVCKYFKFSMRQINRLLNDFDFLHEYFDTSYGVRRENFIIKFLFLPYCLGLKIVNEYQLSEFLVGRGYSKLKEFVFSDEELKDVLLHFYRTRKDISSSTKEELVELGNFLEEQYASYFINDIKNWNMKEEKDKFLDIFSLLSKNSIFN